MQLVKLIDNSYEPFLLIAPISLYQNLTFLKHLKVNCLSQNTVRPQDTMSINLSFWHHSYSPLQLLLHYVFVFFFSFFTDKDGTTITVRGCALDSGTLTTDTEIVRMSHCGEFYYDDK